MRRAKLSIVQGQAERGGDESEREQNKGGMDQIQRGRNKRAPAETRVPEQAGYEPEGIAEPSTGTGLACQRNLRVFDSVVAQIVRTSKCNNSENANQAYLSPAETKQPRRRSFSVVHRSEQPEQSWRWLNPRDCSRRRFALDHPVRVRQALTFER
jgi:hypothetical protein